MSNTVVSFAPKQVIREDASSSYRTERYVSGLRVCERVAELMRRARLSRFHTNTSPVEIARCASCAANIARGLPAPSAVLRVLEVVEWYERWCDEHFVLGRSRMNSPDEQYMPIVHGGPSLERKFISLENRMRAANNAARLGETVDEVIARLFNGSRVLADSFRLDVLGRAGGIDFAAPECVVAEKLGVAYQAIRAARPGGSTPEGAPGPLSLLERYVEWLGDKGDWNMTTRVLSIESPAFQQFRRELAARHPRGADPVTGRESGE